MLLITFTGLDGSGKSTQLELLKEKIKKARKTFLALHILDFSLANQIAQRIKKKGNQKKRAKTSSSKFGIFLRKIFLLIDIFRFRFFLNKTRKKNFDFLLVDRYFFDQIINILFLENQTIFHQKPLWQKLTEKFIIQPDYAFYFFIEPNLVQNRKRLIEQGHDYLEKKKIILDKLTSDWHLQKIDANQKKETINDQIWQFIQKNN